MESIRLQEGFDWGREVLKWVAIATMTVDHIGAVLYPDIIALRIVGRIAFPLFAYLLVLGVESSKTPKSLRNYFLGLFAFAIISQPPFYLALGYAPFDALNIFFTLSFGILVLSMPLLILPLGIVSLFINFDYGVYGLVLIACIFQLRRGIKTGLFFLVLLNAVSLLLWDIQIFSLLAVPLMLLHMKGYLKILGNRESFPYPRWAKYFYYAYYPAHLTLLYLIRTHVI